MDISPYIGTIVTVVIAVGERDNLCPNHVHIGVAGIRADSAAVEKTMTKVLELRRQKG